ncbi:helix-turn-helix transcriptional regulator [Rhodococcus sp. WB9]|uniref:winged helix-turn-helix transcriptional regulator n=1 Tax=Rhodococcus sp. WB9 TaxID=2594007 RepID=UPI0011847571|nr:helix-turn-helix domain-containing protein [Rhodococcus sp. WB9]QDQ91418.1 helix-turn-helix transcriptional regulator [Rhodococcus sp. WB9]
MGVALGTGYSQQNCNLARALEVVGERWTMLVLRDCFYGVRRFSDLLAHLDISRAVLTDRLTALVEAGVLERVADGGHPEYELTEAGKALWPSIYALSQWGEQYVSPGSYPGRVFSHAECGTQLDRFGRCPDCGTIPGPEDLVVAPGPGEAVRPRSDAVAVALRAPRRMLTPLRPRSDA